MQDVPKLPKAPTKSTLIKYDILNYYINFFKIEACSITKFKKYKR